jgi:hypothetical protein
MKRFGIIIAIEEYSTAILPELRKIDFAINDALSIKKVFSDQVDISDENLVFLTNESATKLSIENHVQNILSRITSEDELFFYYVGHGYNSNAHNFFTCWETDNLKLEETSFSIQDILLNPLLEKGVKTGHIFIDSSAEEIKSRNKVKSFASNLVEKEYSELIRASTGHSVYLSCYPGEKSFTSVQAKHGIWALHLLNALNGKDDGAINKGNAITNHTLSTFLSLKIPQYITKSMFINDRQSPYSVVDLKTSTTILSFEDSEEEQNKNVEIKFNQYLLSREENIPYKNFTAFNKMKHKIPKDHSSFSAKLANELAQDEYLKVEIEDLFEKARKALRLKNSNTAKDPESGSLHTEFFRYNISADQSEVDCTEVTILRELELRLPLSGFPMPINDIFSEGFDTITFPINGALDVDSIEDALYELEDDNQGSFENKENLFLFYPKNLKGIAKVEISKNNLKIRFSSSQTSVTDILDFTQKTLEVMATTLKNLLSN